MCWCWGKNLYVTRAHVCVFLCTEQVSLGKEVKEDLSENVKCKLRPKEWKGTC